LLSFPFTLSVQRRCREAIQCGFCMAFFCCGRGRSEKEKKARQQATAAEIKVHVKVEPPPETDAAISEAMSNLERYLLEWDEKKGSYLRHQIGEAETSIIRAEEALEHEKTRRVSLPTLVDTPTHFERSVEVKKTFRQTKLLEAEKQVSIAKANLRKLKKQARKDQTEKMEALFEAVFKIFDADNNNCLSLMEIQAFFEAYSKHLRKPNRHCAKKLVRRKSQLNIDDLDITWDEETDGKKYESELWKEVADILETGADATVKEKARLLGDNAGDYAEQLVDKCDDNESGDLCAKEWVKGAASQRNFMIIMANIDAEAECVAKDARTKAAHAIKVHRHHHT